MTLFGLLNMGRTSLLAHQRAMSTTGENLANVNTPGYVRRRPVFTESFGYTDGRLYYGTGVDLVRIERVADRVLDRRISMEKGELGFWQALEDVSTSVESIFNEPQNLGLSDVLNSFWEAWQALSVNPEGTTERNQVVEKAKQLVEVFSQTRTSLERVVEDGVQKIRDWVSHVNTIIKNIAGLNKKIKEVEREGLTANDLRNKLYKNLKELSSLTGAYYYEGSDGVQVYLDNGAMLVSGSNYNEIGFEEGDFLRKEVGVLNDVVYNKNIEFEKNYLRLTVSGEDVTRVIKGKMGGTINGLITFADGYLAKVDRLISEIAYNVNRIHVTGVGAQKLSSFTSEARVTNPDAPLKDQKSLFFEDRLVNGAFEVRVWDQDGNLVESRMIDVDPYDSLNTVVDRINKMDKVTAYVTQDGRLVVSSDAGYTLSFGSDSSGFLTSMGINTFFTGDSIFDIDVSGAIKSNNMLVAAGSTPALGDNAVALAIAQLSSEKLMENERTFGEYYDNLVGELGAKVARVKDVKEDTDRFVGFLEDRWESVSGVNIDEEMTNLMKFQRAFEAAARYITTVDEMIDRVVNGMGVVGR